MQPARSSIETSAATPVVQSVSWREAFRVWARVAALSFGGPAGQIAVMHRILVEEKRWISESRFLHALNYCMLLPGPEAQQLATYIGWLMHRTPGGLLAGGLFILPGVISIMILSWIYALYGNVGIIAGLFFGLKAAVLAIVLDAVVRISRRALKSNVLIVLAATAFMAIFALQVPFPLIVLGAGLLGFVGGRAGWDAFPSAVDRALTDAAEPTILGNIATDRIPSMSQTFRVAGSWLALWLLPVAALIISLGPGNVFSEIAIFFAKMAMVTFGGAYAALAYVVLEWPRRHPGH
jgi:chromate transporter